MVDVFKEIENKGKTAEALEMGVLSLRQVAESYLFLQKVIDSAKASMEKLSPTLQKEEVQETFLEEERKVIVVPGSTKTTIQSDVVRRFCTPETYNKMATVTEKAIKDNYAELEGVGFSEKAEVIIAKAKKESGKNPDTVKVKKLSKTELKELRG